MQKPIRVWTISLVLIACTFVPCAASDEESKALNNKGTDEFAAHNYSQAEEDFKNAYRVAAKDNNPKRMRSALINLATLYEAQGKKDLAARAKTLSTQVESLQSGRITMKAFPAKSPGTAISQEDLEEQKAEAYEQMEAAQADADALSEVAQRRREISDAQMADWQEANKAKARRVLAPPVMAPRLPYIPQQPPVDRAAQRRETEQADYKRMIDANLRYGAYASAGGGLKGLQNLQQWDINQLLIQRNQGN